MNTLNHKVSTVFVTNSLLHKYIAWGLIWSALILASLGFNLNSLSEHTYNAARAAALATVNKDISFRRWAASHGGVYVPPTARAPANPYLSHPERDVTTNFGKSLTLMNPAYMLRDMQLHFGDEYGVKTNITSLHPINPKNIADPWEIKALKGFETNPNPIEELSDLNGQPYMRLMRPFVVEADCLKCHGHQGYKIGEIRGGIATAVPMRDYYLHEGHRQIELAWTHGAVWFLGLIGFSLGWRREQKIEKSRESVLLSLQESELLYRAVTDNGQALIWMTNAQQQWIFFNLPWLTFTGRELAQTLKQGWTADVHPEDRENCLAQFHQAFEQKIEFSRVYRLRRFDATYRQILEEASPRYNSANQFVGYVGHCLDITDLKEAQSKVDYLANFDVLTHLPNRHLVLNRLQMLLENTTTRSQFHAILLMDLDNFKILNETQGHEFGDLLLKQVAHRLLDIYQDKSLLGRMGGDEFICVLENLGEKETNAVAQAEFMARKMMNLFNQPFNFMQQDYQSSCSLGIVLFSSASDSVDELLKHAEVAMYQAKEAGRNSLRFFDPQMQALVSQRSELEFDLRKAIQAEDFVIYLQPQVDQSETIYGAEVLVRWQDKRRGLVGPDEFIPLAEETGLILPIGHWVLSQACQLLAHWATQPEFAHLTLAVNVSARQIHQADFVTQVMKLLHQTGIQPNRLKLEVTESVLANQIEEMMEKMHELKQLGLRFSLDDFGTGYSSLSYLKRLPLDQLKIDQSFVKEIVNNSNDNAIAKMVTALSQTLELEVIAEGVETPEQRQALANLGCFHYQGYLFGRPMPVAEFEQIILKTI